MSVSHIYLVGYTPSPIDQFKRERRDISKVALGAEKSIPWSHHESIEALISKLKEDGFQIIALEQDGRSVDYKKIDLPDKTAIIIGEEVKGIPKNLLDQCDFIVEIPMKGKKESLNVSVAAGVALFRMLNI